VGTLGVNNLAIRPKSQTDLAGSEDNYLYRSRSLSRCTWRRMELARDQCGQIKKYFVASYCISAHNWKPETIQARV
jgi:hypothetical protein